MYSLRVCRSCSGSLEALVDLGSIHLSGFLAPGEADRPTAPLVLCACATCKLVQLQHTVERQALFSHYWYLSGINEVMQHELQDIVDQAVARVGPFAAGDAVLDIGANDGTLLDRYRHHHVFPLQGVVRLAYEPATNLQHALKLHADVVVPDYFPERYGAVIGFEGRVKVITSIAMVYAVDALAPFLTAIAALLHEDGVWVVQFQDLAQMLSQRAFDNICHEHLTYPSLESFRAWLPPYGLEVVDAERRAINGGSLRLTVMHQGRQPISPHVPQLLAAEAGCQAWDTLERFEGRVQETVRHIRAAVETVLERQQTIDLYGASTKANTLLQVSGLTNAAIRQAWERSPEKVGRVTCGTHIPIVSEEAGRNRPPEALLLGIWQFKDAALAREHAYLQAGGTVIVPLPNVEIIRAERHRVA